MPWQSIKLVPGLDSEQTPSLLEGRFTSASLVRWREGLVEKLGGWKPFYTNPFPSKICELKAWLSLNGSSYLGVALRGAGVYALSNNSLTTLTPQVFTSDISPNFSTTLGSSTVTIVDSNLTAVSTNDTIVIQTPVAVGGLVLFGQYTVNSVSSPTTYTITAASNAVSNATSAGSVASFTTANSSSYVTVTLTAHGLLAGNTINFPTSTSIGGLTIAGIYTVSSVTDANNFIIAASNSATSSAGPTAMNGGNVHILYDIGIGPVAGAGGWGTGGYGVGGWGTGSTVAGQTGTPVAPTDWTLANWGEDLIACPAGGTLYYWGPESGAQTLYPIPNAPPFNNGCMIAMPQLILVAWGSTSTLSLGTSQDPLLVKWSDAGNFTTWTATNANLAGDFRLGSKGSQIVGGYQSTFRTLLWTDVECWAMDYIGYPYSFSFNVVGTNCGLAARGAVTELSGSVVWMSPSNFYILSGGTVRALPCPVYDAVFQDLDLANISKVKAGANPAFNEIWFFYPSISGGTGENDKYVKVNLSENAWDYGVLPRTAWLTQSLLGAPIGAGTDNILYQHEQGYDANSSALTPSWSTGWISLSEGEDIPFVDLFVPDMRWGTYKGSSGASVQFSFQSANYPSDTPQTYGPYTVNSSTEFIPLRIRQRLISLSMSSSDSGTFWRMGKPRFRIASSGRN